MSATATSADVLSGSARWAVLCGDASDALRTLPADCVHCAITSPPYYGLRDYGVPGQIGLEPTPAEYVARMVAVFRAVRRVLHPSGVLWLNLGDSYNAYNGNRGSSTSFQAATEEACPSLPSGYGLTDKSVKPKDLLGIPWEVAFALRADGWYLRQWCPWVKRNPMPESVTDRPGTACECVFLLAKRGDYFFDGEAVKRGFADERMGNPGNYQHKLAAHETPGGVHGKSVTGGGWNEDGAESGRNFRNSDLWFDSVGMLLSDSPDDPDLLGFDVTLTPYKGAHFAVMPRKLIEPMVLAGTSAKGVCPACGEPWRRVVKRDRKPTRPGKDTKVTDRGALSPTNGDSGEYSADGRAQFRSSAVVGNRDPERHCTTTETVGWEPGCDCPAAEPVPAVVLDPFAGSGTVPAVAVEHNRRALGCELNPAYLKLIHKRMRKVTPALTGLFAGADT